jgi:copper(I)-binding protein
MRMLDKLTIPAGGKLEMKPGGTHLMLMGLTGPLKAGESLPLTLTFEKAGAATVPVEVVPMGASMPMPGMDHTM